MSCRDWRQRRVEENRSAHRKHGPYAGPGQLHRIVRWLDHAAVRECPARI